MAKAAASKNLSYLALLIIIVVAAGLYVSGPRATTGRAVFTLSDAAADLGAVSSVAVTVDSVSIHSDTTGWVTVSSTPQTYDLLQLRAEGSQVVLADVQIPEGTYQQTRLHISKVIVTDAEGTHDAVLPSGELKIVGIVQVAANTTAAVKFDFIADESLLITGEGTYVCAPVVQFEARASAQVSVDASSRATVSNGSVTSAVKVGMDIAGNVGVNYRIPPSLNVTVRGRVISVIGPQ